MAGVQDIMNFLFGGSKSGGDADDELVASTVEAIVDQVEPRVRLDSSYQKKLTGGVRHTLAYLRSLRDQLPQEIVPLARSEWAMNPHLNAFFATADDVPALIGRTRELRSLFQTDPKLGEAFALLAMKMEERHIFAPKLEGTELHHDVAQTTIGFTGHKLFSPAPTLAQTRLDVGKRLFMRLAQVALKRIIQSDERASDLDQHKGYLKTRLRLLNLAKDGLEGIVEDASTIDAQIRDIERQLKDTVDEFIEIKSSIATLDRYTDRINDILRNPEQHLSIEHRLLRVNRMGMKVEAGDEEPAHELSLYELQLDDIRAIIALVRCAREEMPPVEDLVAKAERYL